jgi:hypothetical protein
MDTYRFDLPKIIENLRARVRAANKQELVLATGIPYTRLIYFARSAMSTPNPQDVTALMAHYMPNTAFVVPGPIPPAPVDTGRAELPAPPIAMASAI